jgi:hypothetical protein
VWRAGINPRKRRARRLGMMVHAVISALRRLRQEDCEFKASLGYIVRHCPKKKSKK